MFEAIFLAVYSWPVLISVAVVVAIAFPVLCFWYYSDTLEFIRERFRNFVLISIIWIEVIVAVPFAWPIALCLAVIVAFFYGIWYLILGGRSVSRS